MRIKQKCMTLVFDRSLWPFQQLKMHSVIDKSDVTCGGSLSAMELSAMLQSALFTNNNNNNAGVFILRRWHRMTMYESSPTCEQRRITFNDDGQRVQLARSELTASHYIFMYRLLPTTPPLPSRHYYPRLIAGTNLPTPKGWIAWLAKADCTHITFAQGYYTIEAKGTRRKWTQVVGFKTNSIPVNQPRRT